MTGARLIAERLEHPVRSVLAGPTGRPCRHLEPEPVEFGHPPLPVPLFRDEREDGGALLVELEPIHVRRCLLFQDSTKRQEISFMTCPLLVTVGERFDESADAGHVDGAGTDPVLMVSRIIGRWQQPFHIEAADAFRAPDFMGAERIGVNPVDGDRDLAERLDAVDVEQHFLIFQLAEDVVERERPSGVRVDVLERDEPDVTVEQMRERLVVEPSVLQLQAVNDHAFCFPLVKQKRDRVVLLPRRDDFTAFHALPETREGDVVAFGAASGEEELAAEHVEPERLLQQPSGFGQVIFRHIAVRVEGRRVTVYASCHGHVMVESGFCHRVRRRIIKVTVHRKFPFSHVVFFTKLCETSLQVNITYEKQVIYRCLYSLNGSMC